MLNREGEKTDEAHVSISFDSIPVSPYQILVLASCIKNMAPDYKLLTHSSYFFVRVVTALAEKLLLNSDLFRIRSYREHDASRARP